MLPIIWRASARDDLANIIRYIANENPPAARRMKRLLEESVLPTAEHPYLYRQSERIPGLVLLGSSSIREGPFCDITMRLLILG